MSEIEPALTPSQWEDHLREVDDGVRDGAVIPLPSNDPDIRIWVTESHGEIVSENDDGEGAYNIRAVGRDRHALAAICLFGQPFGFTREMAQAINALAWTYAGDPLEGMTPEQRKAEMERIRGLAKEAAARIEALLPPEGK